MVNAVRTFGRGRRFRGDLLLKLATFLRTKVSPVDFDFNEVRRPRTASDIEAIRSFGKHTCGTVACAFGWTPEALGTELIRIHSNGFRDCVTVRGKRVPGHVVTAMMTAAMRLFGITRAEARGLFLPGEDRAWVSSGAHNLLFGATIEQVAESIERFVAWKNRRVAAKAAAATRAARAALMATATKRAVRQVRKAMREYAAGGAT